MGDFNGDDFPDVAVFGKDHVTGQTAIAVMLGNGNGTFQTGKESIIGGSVVPPTSPCAAKVADFNGDDKLDIAYVSNQNVIIVLEGKGDGTFSAPVSSSTGSPQFHCITSGDFNNDKKLDIAGSTASGFVLTALGNGNGTFATPVLAGKGGPGPLAAAQLNADSDTDLVAITSNGITLGVTVFLGNGTGKFPTTHSYTLLQTFRINGGPVVRDLNGDGHADIALIASTRGLSTLVEVLLNNGDCSFSQGPKYNGDGTGRVRILRRRCQRRWQARSGLWE